jgi:hypothetical protein
MSKMDNLRAMREARFEAAQKAARPAAARRAPVAPAEKTAAPKAAVPKEAAPDAVESAESGSCGHQSMNGRRCTREAGHAAKSHRYS